MPKDVIVKGEGITLDLLLFRAYGVPGQALVTPAWGLNPGLADKCKPDIPVGTRVWLPDRPGARRPTRRRVVSLF